MDFWPPKLKLPLFAAIMGAMAVSAAAQQSGQSIIFSTPQNSDAQSITPSLTPQNSQLPVLPGTLQAPDASFNFQASDNFPALPPPSSANILQDRRMKKLLDDRKNWTLMTPAEIFGVEPTEELLQPSERDALGQEKNLTQVERYLDRQDQSRGGLTNGWQNDQDNAPWNFSRDENNINPLDSGRDNWANAMQKFSRFSNGQRNDDTTANRDENNDDWDSFRPAVPQIVVKPDLEQVAAMERFRQLLEPGSAPAVESAAASKFFPASKTASVLDPNITQPDFMPNPAGASFTPLSSGIKGPTGLTPLPGIVSPVTAPVTVPAWMPRPAPWLLQGPQPLAVP